MTCAVYCEARITCHNFVAAKRGPKIGTLQETGIGTFNMVAMALSQTEALDIEPSSGVVRTITSYIITVSPISGLGRC
jgi:hypothetical protein